MEHALMLIKPGRHRKGILEELTYELNSHKLDICMTKTMHLSREQVEVNFSTLLNRDEYIDYMTSGLVDVFIIKGIHAIEKAKIIKNKIRKKHMVDSKMINNLIHSSDEGLEYFLQFTCCFPNVNIKLFTGYADMLATDENKLSSMQAVICDPTVDAHSVKYSRFFVHSYEVFVNQSIVRCLTYTKRSCNKASFKYVEECVYESKENQGFVAIDLFGVDNTKIAIEQLPEKGVIAANVFDSRYCLDDSKDLQEIINEYDLISIGGSYMLSNTGLITISENTFTEILKKGGLI